MVELNVSHLQLQRPPPFRSILTALPVCAHAAFLDQNADPSRPRRRSIEVRALVITKRE